MSWPRTKTIALKLVLPLTLLALLCFNNWALGPWLNPLLTHHDGSISELSVTNQPYSWVFRALDIIAGLLFIVIALMYNRLMTAHAPGPRKLLVWSTVILGIADIVDASLPLHCSTTLQGNCVETISLSLHNFQLPSHAYSSVIIAASYLVLPAAGLWFYFKHKSAKAFGIVSAVLILAALVSLIGQIAVFILLGGFTTEVMGGAQELQMVLLSCWFLAWYLELPISVRGKRL